MRLVVKQIDGTAKEFRFTKGPIYIGRHTHSQVFLPDRAVSRQHAVIFATQDGKWMVEDLDSVNKTYLNSEPVHKAEIKTGDVLVITDYTIEIYLEGGDTRAAAPTYLDDTLAIPSRDSQVMVRSIDAELAPEVKLSAKRVKDFAQATEEICEADGLDEILQTLLRILEKQFSAFHVWCALRNEPTGPMIAHAGKRQDGKIVQLSDIKLNEKITEAVEKKQFLLLYRVPAQPGEERINSAMIAPIVGAGGCFGALYVDNAMDHERYSPSDLDYLMLLVVHAASILKNF